MRFPLRAFPLDRASRGSYVQRKFAFLFDAPEAPTSPPCHISVNVPFFRQSTGAESLASAHEACIWYRHSMLTERVITQDDYAVLRADRSDVFASGSHPGSSMDDLLPTRNFRLPPLPQKFAAYQLPTDIWVPEALLLQYFASYVNDLAANQQPTAQRQFDVALHIEFTAMIVGALAMDHYWTDRSVLQPEATIHFLRESALSSSFAVLWVDGAESRSLTVRELVYLPTAIQYAGLRKFYMRFD